MYIIYLKLLIEIFKVKEFEGYTWEVCAKKGHIDQCNKNYFDAVMNYCVAWSYLRHGDRSSWNLDSNDRDIKKQLYYNLNKFQEKNGKRKTKQFKKELLAYFPILLELTEFEKAFSLIDIISLKKRKARRNYLARQYNTTISDSTNIKDKLRVIRKKWMLKRRKL